MSTQPQPVTEAHTETPIRKGDLVTLNYTDQLGGPLRLAIVVVPPSEADPDRLEAVDPVTARQDGYRTAQVTNVFTASTPPGAAKAHAQLVARRAAEDADDAKRKAASIVAQNTREYEQRIRGSMASPVDNDRLRREEAAFVIATPDEKAAIVAAWAVERDRKPQGVGQR
jgi:hypothetical protein